MTSQQTNHMSDHSTIAQKVKPVWSLRLFLFSLSLVVLTFLLATFWIELGFTDDQTIWLALILTIAFGISIAGCVMGFFERTKNRIRSIIGIVGNVLLILSYFGLIAYSLGTVPPSH